MRNLTSSIITWHRLIVRVMPALYTMVGYDGNDAVNVGDDTDPFARMLADLEKSRGNLRTDADRVHGTAQQRYDIAASKFVKVSMLPPPKKMAFVDGGNGTLALAPNYLMALNHVCYTVFKGAQRIPAGQNGTRQKITFLSCTVPRAGAYSDVDGTAQKNENNTGEKKPQASRLQLFDTRIYPYHDNNRHDEARNMYRYLPDGGDLSISSADTKTNVIQDTLLLPSVARRLAEIKLARIVVEDELEPGDMLVMDGSLQTSFGMQKKYAARLYDAAVKKGVIICGLAKTSKLTTISGEPLMSRIAEISQDVLHDRWYVPVAEKIYEGGRGFTVAVKLHPRSKFVFRLDILHEQYDAMTDAERDSVVSSLAANSDDASIPGYPYGAMDADKRAKVRSGELAVFRRALYSQCSGNARWQYLLRHADSVIFHELLNKVTG